MAAGRRVTWTNHSVIGAVLALLVKRQRHPVVIRRGVNRRSRRQALVDDLTSIVDAHVDVCALERPAAGRLGTWQLHSSQSTGVTGEAEYSRIVPQREGRIERVEQKSDCYITRVVEPHPAHLPGPKVAPPGADRPALMICVTCRPLAMKDPSSPDESISAVNATSPELFIADGSKSLVKAPPPGAELPSVSIAVKRYACGPGATVLAAA